MNMLERVSFTLYTFSIDILEPCDKYAVQWIIKRTRLSGLPLPGDQHHSAPTLHESYQQRSFFHDCVVGLVASSCGYLFLLAFSTGLIVFFAALVALFIELVGCLVCGIFLLSSAHDMLFRSNEYL